MFDLSDDGTPLAVFTTSYDPVGNPLVVRELDGSVVTLAYDVLDQLTTELRSDAGTPSNSYTMLYQWDPVGNPAQVTQDSYVGTVMYDSANAYDTSLPYDPGTQYTAGQTAYTVDPANALSQLQYGGNTPLALASDADGNLTSDQVPTGLPGVYQSRSYAWDDSDRLKSVTAGASVETYLYSADGMRWQKNAAGQTVTYVRDGENVLQEVSGSTPSAYYTQFPGEWGGLLSRRDLVAGQSSYYGFDPQGNARILVTPGAASPDSYGYTGFGMELGTGAAKTNPFRFGGQYGYYGDDPFRLYVRARHLSVDKGRWLSPDPLSQRNLYDYALNNPVSYVDPSGLAAWQSDPVMRQAHRIYMQTLARGQSVEAALAAAQFYLMQHHRRARIPAGTPTSISPDEFLFGSADDPALILTEEDTQRIAEAGGTIPVVGIASNAVAVVIAVHRGDRAGAAFDVVAMIPLESLVAGGARLARSGAQLARASTVTRAAREGLLARSALLPGKGMPAAGRAMRAGLPQLIEETDVSLARAARIGSSPASIVAAARRRLSARRMLLAAFRKKGIPITFGDLISQGSLGETTEYGEITLDRSLRGQELKVTMQHELVHSYLSPTKGTRLASVRARLVESGYKNSAMLMYLEEALAEGWARRSIRAGLKWPFEGGYIVGTKRKLALAVQGTTYVTIVVGVPAGSYWRETHRGHHP